MPRKSNSLTTLPSLPFLCHSVYLLVSEVLDILRKIECDIFLREVVIVILFFFGGGGLNNTLINMPVNTLGANKNI